MTVDYVALKAELTTDPKVLGYSALLAAGNDGGIAALLNATTGAGAATITIPSYSREQLVTGILPAIIALGSATAALQAKWTPLLGVAQSMSHIEYAVAAPLLSQLVTDGLLTQAQVDAFTKRTGSRAEVLFGAGTVVRVEDMVLARSA